MTAASISPALALTALLMVGTPAAGAELERQGGPGSYAWLAAASGLYQLADPVPLTSLRWTPLTSSRLELAAGLLPRHEMRLTASGGAITAGPDAAAWSADGLRATYRYTFLTQAHWAWKVGITARLSDGAQPARFADPNRFSTRPLMHLAGEGRLAPNWRVSFDADGWLTARGRALEIGVRMNYSLTPAFSLFGGYRYADQTADADEHGAGSSNGANVGLRYRF